MSKVIIIALLIIFGAIIYETLFPKSEEGFQVMKNQCGVGIQSCPAGTRCINGYCYSNAPPSFPPLTDLPVLPAGRAY